MKRRKKLPRAIGAPLASASALAALLLAASSWQRVEFADAGLEAAVRAKLGIPQRPISRTELLQISRLDASGRKIARLEGIEYLRQLVVLNLAHNRLQDVSPLRTLRKLRDLDLSKNHLSSLKSVGCESLVGLRLRRLDLGHNRIAIPSAAGGPSDGDLLGRCLSLEELDLADNLVSSVAPLSGLSRLRLLDLRTNRIADLSPLSGLSSLEELDLGENDVADLSALAGLGKLSYLNLRSNRRIASLEPLKDLTGLKTLIMRDVPAGADLSALRKLKSLRRLNARNCGIGDTAVLGELMASGALRDDPETGEEAEVNLLQNALPAAGSDPYRPIRPYWGSISYRTPFALPWVPGKVPPPNFSREGGFSGEPFELELVSSAPGAAIHYTLDGSEPTERSARYDGPLRIAPGADPSSGRVVRARLVGEGGEASDVVTHTYFVGEGFAAGRPLPAVSLATDPANLFDRGFGIYSDSNALKTGWLWERPVSVEFFEADGRRVLNADGGVRIQGAWSRRRPRKSLRLYARPEYGPSDAFRYPFFPGLKKAGSGEPLSEFKTLILHNSGNDYNGAVIRDALLQGLVEHSPDLETQASRFVTLYLNGSYWGLYCLRERLDEHCLAANYDVPPERVAILELDAEVKHGTGQDREEYLALRDYAKTRDLSDPASYRHLVGTMDPRSLIEYYSANIYFHNVDWAYNNIGYWRIRPEGSDRGDLPGRDGRWRWMLFDVDSGFALERPPFRTIERFERKHGPSSGPAANTLKWALMVRDLRFEQRWPNLLFRSLLANGEFRNAFINRLADELNSSFLPERVIQRIDELEEALLPEMAAQIRRWGEIGSVEEWRRNVEGLRRFARERPEHVRRHFVEHFGLGGCVRVNLRADPREGHVRINGLTVAESTPGIRRPQDWTGVYFRGVPVRIAAIPEKGYRFAGWEGTELKEAEITLVPEGDLELAARFERESRD